MFERKIKFSPFALTSLRRSMFVNERRPYWPMEKFDPDYMVECEIPEYLLRKVLPPESFDSAAMSKADGPMPKRQQNDPGNEGTVQGQGKKPRMSDEPDISDKENGNAPDDGKRASKNSRNTIVSRGTGQGSLAGPSNVIDLTDD